MLRVLVAGGTGETGRRVVDGLVRRGDVVRVLSRRASRAHRILGANVEVHEGDVREPDSLLRIAQGIDVAVIATGTRSYFGSNGGAAVDAMGNRHLIESLEGVGQVVLLSAFGVDRSSPALTIFSAALGGYFKWKAEAESAVRGAGVPATIVRPVELRNRPPKGPPKLNQSAPWSVLRTVSRDLVAEVLVHVCGHSDALGKTFEVCEGGGETPSLDVQLAELKPEGERSHPPRTPLFGSRV